MLNIKILGKCYKQAIIDMGLDIVVRVKSKDDVTKGNLVKIYREEKDYGKGVQVGYRIELKSRIIGYINEIATLEKHNKPKAWIKAVEDVRRQLVRDYDMYGISEWNGEVYDIIWYKDGVYKSHWEMNEGDISRYEFNQLGITMHMDEEGQ